MVTGRRLPKLPDISGLPGVSKIPGISKVPAQIPQWRDLVNDPAMLRRGFNVWPPFRFAGIRVVDIQPEFRLWFVPSMTVGAVAGEERNDVAGERCLR